MKEFDRQKFERETNELIRHALSNKASGAIKWFWSNLYKFKPTGVYASGLTEIDKKVLAIKGVAFHKKKQNDPYSSPSGSRSKYEFWEAVFQCALRAETILDIWRRQKLRQKLGESKIGNIIREEIERLTEQFHNPKLGKPSIIITKSPIKGRGPWLLTATNKYGKTEYSWHRKKKEAEEWADELRKSLKEDKKLLPLGTILPKGYDLKGNPIQAGFKIIDDRTIIPKWKLVGFCKNNSIAIEREIKKLSKKYDNLWIFVGGDKEMVTDWMKRNKKRLQEGTFEHPDYYITLGDKGVYFVIRSQYTDPQYGTPRDHLAQNLSTSNPDVAARKIAEFEKKHSVKVVGDPHNITPGKKAASVRIDPNVIPFGKYQGRTIEDVAGTDLNYLIWLAGSPIHVSQRVKQEFVNRLKDMVKMKAGDPAEIVPFGKYKGVKLSDLAKKDMPYLLWLYDQTNQSDFEYSLKATISVIPEFKNNLEKVTKIARQKREREQKGLASQQGWLIDFLKQQGRYSSFAASIAKDLEKGRKFGELPEKARDIVAKMWAERGGDIKGKRRAGSKPYQVVEKEFWNKIKQDKLMEKKMGRKDIRDIIRETLAEYEHCKPPPLKKRRLASRPLTRA